MTKPSLSLLVFAAMLGLAACASPPPKDAKAPADTAAPANPEKTVGVNRLRLEFTARFAPGRSDLAPLEASKLAAFLAQANIRADDRVYLVPADGDPLAAARIGRIVRELAPRGVGAETVTPAPEPVAADHLLMLVDRYVVAMPACPDWSQPPEGTHENDTASNFGCANATNFGLMIDSPRDLAEGRTPGPADAEPALGAIERYRGGAVKPFGGAGGSSSGGAAASTSGGSGSGGGQ